MTNYLTPGEWFLAVGMFKHGADTLMIAVKFQCSEALVYNCLPIYRKKYRGVAA